MSKIYCGGIPVHLPYCCVPSIYCLPFQPALCIVYTVYLLYFLHMYIVSLLHITYFCPKYHPFALNVSAWDTSRCTVLSVIVSRHIVVVINIINIIIVVLILGTVVVVVLSLCVALYTVDFVSIHRLSFSFYFAHLPTAHIYEEEGGLDENIPNSFHH